MRVSRLKQFEINVILFQFLRFVKLLLIVLEWCGNLACNLPCSPVNTENISEMIY